MNVQFGTGVLLGSPLSSSGNPPGSPTPVRFGVIQEAMIDFKADLKKLYGQSQFPVATARGKFDVSVKAKVALFDPTMLQQLYFAQTQTSGYALISDLEAQTVSSNAAVVSNIPILTDWGVQYANGQTVIRDSTNVVVAPTGVGHYTGPNLTSGKYNFNTGDNNQQVRISYTYNSTAGATIAIANQLMGYAPEIAMFFYDRFRGKYLAVTLNDVTLGQISIPSKLEDFWITDIDGSANADVNGNIGALAMDLA